MTGRRRRALAVVLAVAALAPACTSDGDQKPVDPAALHPVGTAAGVTPTSATPPVECANPEASTQRPSTAFGPFLAQIRDRGKLRVGVSQDTLLFGYRNPENNLLEGFDVDVAKEVAKAIFRVGDDRVMDHLDLKAISSAQRIPFLQAGTIDLVARTMTMTCTRATQVAFSTVYYRATQRVLVSDASPATSLADLGGQRVCAGEGTTSIDNIRATEPDANGNRPVPVEAADLTDCLVEFQLGNVDAISTDDAILAGFAAQDPYAKIVGPALAQEPYGLAMPLGADDVVAFVNGVLERMRNDGTWARLYGKWLPALGPAPSPPAATYG